MAAKDMTPEEKLRRLGKAKYGLKFIRVVAGDGRPFLVLEHRGHNGRRMLDAYGLSDGSIDEEYDRYFGRQTVNEAMKAIVRKYAGKKGQ